MLLGAPVTAEYLQNYLTDTGRPLHVVAGVVFFAPLYGGAALLIRELAVRRGLGWRGILLLAATFGLVMTAVIDVSLWTPARADVPYWAELRAHTMVSSLGIAFAPLVSWVLGHVVFSIAVPLALLDGLAPSTRGRPLLSRAGTTVLAALLVAVALTIHHGERVRAVRPPPAGAILIAALLLVLVAVALFGSRLSGTRGNRVRGELPGADDTRARPPARRRFWLLVVMGAIWAVVAGVAPPTWPGVAVILTLLTGYVVALQLLSRRSSWSTLQVSALAAGAVVVQALLGLLTPLPPGVDPVARTIQAAIQVGLVVGIATLACLRSRNPGPTDSLPTLQSHTGASR